MARLPPSNRKGIMKTLESYTTGAESLGNQNTTASLRTRCPLPVLMKRMGYGKYTKKNCNSPFRTDKHPSFGVYERGGRWYWKDLGNGDHGDEVEFILHARKKDCSGSFIKALDYWTNVASKDLTSEEVAALKVQASEPRVKPDASRFCRGTEVEMQALAQRRNIDINGIHLADELGLLVFGRMGPNVVYGVTDLSGNILEVRRLDGKNFPAYGSVPERKSHAIRGSNKSWPVGIANIGSKRRIVLVEGVPDLLAACEVICNEDAVDEVAPVAILSAGSSIDKEALPLFKGCDVRIIPHSDEPGRAAGQKWGDLLHASGASSVRIVSLSSEESSPTKDLNDYLPIYRCETEGGRIEGRLL